MATFKVGDLVETEKGSGCVAFFGETEFSDGLWVGVELDLPNGKNNGSVKGTTYFSCKDNHGIFIKPENVKLKSSPRGKPSGLRAPSNIKKPTASGSKSNMSQESTPRMTPASSTEQLQMLMDRQKSFGNRGAHQVHSTPTSIPTTTATMMSKIAEPTAGVALRRQSKISQDGDFGVREKIKKIDEHTSFDSGVYKPPSEQISGSTGVAGGSVADGVELEYLKREVKDLNDKLDTLRAKRKEDQEKLKEYERNKIQLQTLTEYKLEMSAAHSTLKTKFEELQKAYEELETDFNQNNEKTDLLERMAIMECDKEMAEEKAEMLQVELDSLVQEKRDLEGEVEMLKAELEGAGSGNVNGEGIELVGNKVQLKQLELQNESCKRAILILRDALEDAKLEMQTHKKDCELAQLERDDLSLLCDKFEKELEESKNSIAILREEADAAMGSEKMISTLTDKNLDLEDRLKALEEDLAELEILRQMDEEIIESQKETEKDLRVDLETHLVAISDLNRKLDEGLKRAEDYERVILKFRQKNADLNECIQQLKDEVDRGLLKISNFSLQILILKEQDEASKGDDESCFSLKTVNLNRTFAEIVDAEITSVELEFSRQHSAYLKSFLPENFAKAGGDNDCVLLCVLFPRIAAKSLALIKLLNLKYPPVPNGLRREHITLSHRGEQWAHVKKFVYSLRALNGVLRKFESVLKNCSVERLSRLAIQQLEITGQERNLDQYIELLKQNRLDENTSVDGLDRIVNFFQKIFSTNLTGETFNARESLANTILQLKEGLAWINFNCRRLSFFLLPSELESTETPSEFSKFVSSLETLLGECESLALRSLNRIPAENDLIMSAEVWDKVMSAIGRLEKAAKIVHTTCGFAGSQLASVDSVEGFTGQQMSEMLHSAVEKYMGSVESKKAGGVLSDCIESIKDFLLEISESLENSSMEIPPAMKNVIKQMMIKLKTDEKKIKTEEELIKPNAQKWKNKIEEHKLLLQGFPPLLERAHSRKNDAVEAEGLRWQIAKKDEEMLKLQKLLKARDGDVSTLKLRLEMADKQMEQHGTGKYGDLGAQRLQERYGQLQEDFVKQKAEYEKSLEALQKSLEQAERDREKEKERVRDFSKRALFANMSQSILFGNSGNISPISPMNPMGGGGGFGSSQHPGNQQELIAMDREYKNTLHDLKWAEKRIMELESRNVKNTLDGMEEMNPPDLVCGHYSLHTSSSSHREKEDEAELSGMMKESEALLRESNMYLVEPLDPKKRAVFRERISYISDRVESLKFRFHRFWSRTHPGEDYPTLFSDLVHQHSLPTKSINAQKPPTQKHRQSILAKWNRDLSEGEKWYGGILNKSQA